MTMKKLNATHLKERSALADAILAAKSDVEEAIGDGNSEMARAVEAAKEAILAVGVAVAAKVNTYNEAVQAANDWRQARAEEMEAYQSERSEKWQEGDAGSAYQSWLDAWGEELVEIEVDLDLDFEIEAPEIEEPDLDHADLLADLPEEP